MLGKSSSILLLYWRIVNSLTAAHALRPAAQRIGVQRRAAIRRPAPWPPGKDRSQNREDHRKRNGV